MERFYKSNTFKRFAPFMLLIIGGSFFIREFTEVRYKYRKTMSYDIREESRKRGIKMKKSTTLEEEYEKLKQQNLDNWEIVRIPRPWEEEENVTKD